MAKLFVMVSITINHAKDAEYAQAIHDIIDLRVVIAYVVAVWGSDIKEVPCIGMLFNAGYQKRAGVSKLRLTCHNL